MENTLVLSASSCLVLGAAFNLDTFTFIQTGISQQPLRGMAGQIGVLPTGNPYQNHRKIKIGPGLIPVLSVLFEDRTGIGPPRHGESDEEPRRNSR